MHDIIAIIHTLSTMEESGNMNTYEQDPNQSTVNENPVNDGMEVDVNEDVVDAVSDANEALFTDGLQNPSSSDYFRESEEECYNDCGPDEVYWPDPSFTSPTTIMPDGDGTTEHMFPSHLFQEGDSYPPRNDFFMIMQIREMERIQNKKRKINSETYKKDPTYRESIHAEFEKLCKAGTVAQIMHFLTEHPYIDCHYDNESHFIVATTNNTLDVVKYLYDRIKPDLSVGHHMAFNYACLGRNLDVALFLAEQSDKYQVLQEGDLLIPQINSPSNVRRSQEDVVNMEDDLLEDIDDLNEYGFDDSDDSGESNSTDSSEDSDDSTGDDLQED